MRVTFDFTDEAEIDRYFTATGETRTAAFDRWLDAMLNLYGFTTVTFTFPDPVSEPPPRGKWYEWRG